MKRSRVFDKFSASLRWVYVFHSLWMHSCMHCSDNPWIAEHSGFFQAANLQGMFMKKSGWAKGFRINVKYGIPKNQKDFMEWS